MSELNSIGESAPLLTNAGVAPPNITSFRNSVPPTANITQSAVPALPPRPDLQLASQNYGMSQPYSYGGMGSYGMGSMGGYGGYGGMGGYGMGGYGGYSGGYGMGMGMNGMGMGMNTMNGQNPYGYGNIESR